MNPKLHDDAVTRLPLATARAELLEEIMSTPVLDRPEPETTPSGRRRWLTPLVAAAAVAALVGTPAWLLAGPEEAREAPAPASSPSSSPTPGEWAVLDAEGWTATYVSSSDGHRAVAYENGEADLEVTLTPAEARDSYVEDRQRINHPKVEPGAPVQLLGADGLMWHYSATDHTTIGEVAAKVYPEVRASGMDEAAYVALLGQLEWTDEAGFEASLPERFVTADEQSSAVSEMMGGIALPPGFEMPSFDEKDPYQLGAAVASQVVCGWIAEYERAVGAGDEDAARVAQDALGGSRDWRFLREMSAEGAYPEWVWETSAEVAAGRVPEGYRQGLGCPWT